MKGKESRGLDSPFTGCRLRDDGEESLDTAENGTVDHHWALERSASDGVLASRHVGRSEFEVEPLGQVEIELES
jgi:hypothetical protein